MGTSLRATRGALRLAAVVLSMGVVVLGCGGGGDDDDSAGGGSTGASGGGVAASGGGVSGGGSETNGVSGASGSGTTSGASGGSESGGSGGNGGNGGVVGGGSGNGGGNGGGHPKVPVSPLKIPDIQVRGRYFDAVTPGGQQTWEIIEDAFRDRCKDHTVCVHLERRYDPVDVPEATECGFVKTEPAKDVEVTPGPGTVVYIVGEGPCAGGTPPPEESVEGGAGSPGDSTPPGGSTPPVNGSSPSVSGP
ncbi:hypothetical protein [Streptomyces sp. NPDC059009]|uniref:hypothetical protein n=1 Tax=Streptomyces sp. NPDC059009 TaxID=3346694 RepID=UPI0036B775AA